VRIRYCTQHIFGGPGWGRTQRTCASIRRHDGAHHTIICTMRHSALISIAIATCMATARCSSCGIVDATDGGTDAGDAAPDVTSDADTLCVAGPFGAPAPIAELNTAANESGFRSTPDELTSVFARLSNTDASAYNDLYLTSRSSFAVPFSTPSVALTAWSSFPEVYPSLAADTLALFLESFCFNSDANGSGTLCVAPRAADSGLDGFTGDVLILSSDQTSGPGPFGAGFSVGDGFVTSNGLTYYAVGLETRDGGGPTPVIDAGLTNAIFVISRTTSALGDMFGGPFAGPILVPSDPTILVDNPVLSSDELTMFVSTTSTTSPVPHVQSSTRATTSDDFGPLTPSHELDSAEGEYPTWISPDQCRLYLTRTVGGQTDIYMASRSPP
jgi:hypothetical protein